MHRRTRFSESAGSSPAIDVSSESPQETNRHFPSEIEQEQSIS